MVALTFVVPMSDIPGLFVLPPGQNLATFTAKLFSTPSTSEPEQLVSNPWSFTVVNSYVVPTSVQVAQVATPGGSTIVTTPVGSLTATLTSGGTTTPTITVATYNAPPSGAKTFFQVGATFYDIRVGGTTPGAGDSLAVTFGGSPSFAEKPLYFYLGTYPYPTPSSAGCSGCLNTTACGVNSGDYYPVMADSCHCAMFGTSGYCTVTLDDCSSPAISQLTGTIFAVGVLNSPQGIVNEVLTELQALLPTISDDFTADILNQAIRSLTEAVEAGLWVDASHVVPALGDIVFQDEEVAVSELAVPILINQLEQLIFKKPVSPLVTTLQGYIGALVGSDRLLAAVAISDATAANGDARKLAEASQELSAGDADNAAGRYDSAIEDYRQAWETAQEATEKHH
jgi:hypothetical protein